jgi:hypothetical protein
MWRGGALFLEINIFSYSQNFVSGVRNRDNRPFLPNSASKTSAPARHILQIQRLGLARWRAIFGSQHFSL